VSKRKWVRFVLIIETKKESGHYIGKPRAAMFYTGIHPSKNEFVSNYLDKTLLGFRPEKTA
jgi:hypothetical protein